MAATAPGAEESPAGSEDNESSNGSEDIKRWEWRWWVDAIAKMAAVSVLAGGILLVILPIGAHGDHFTEDPDQPHVVTNAVTEYSGASPARPKTTRTIVRSRSGTTTKSVVEDAHPEVKTTVTVTEEKRSLLERAFGAGGFFLFRLGLVGLAAFLAGGLVQRGLLAAFSVELPFLKFGALPTAARESRKAIKRIENSVQRQLKAVTDEVAAELAASNDKIADATGDSGKVAEATAGLARAVQALDERVGQLERKS